MSKILYFDEYGITGDNLLDPEQPWFSYACAELESADIDFFLELVQSHRIKMHEIKGQKIFRRVRKGANNYIDFVKKFSTYFSNKGTAYLIDKRFAFCCKVFEYLIEPLISPINSLFYENQFNRTIANILYFDIFVLKEPLCQVFKDSFLQAVRLKDPNKFYTEELFYAFQQYFSENSEPQLLILPQILSLAFFGQDEIRAEFKQFDEKSYYLDVSGTTLHLMLTKYSSNDEGQEIYIDNSMYLSKELLDRYKAGIITQYINTEGEKVSKRIKISDYHLVTDSSQSLGIQIADLLARLSGYIFKDSDTPIKESINIDYFCQLGGLIYESNLVLDPEAAVIQRTMGALHTLIERMERDIPITAYLEEYYGYYPVRVYDIHQEALI